MRTVHIYGLWDPRDGRMRYIGKTAGTIHDRLMKHIRETKKKGATTHLRCWITGVLNDGEIPIIDLLEETTEEEWKFVERDWIRQCREMGVDIVNLCDGGQGGSYKGHPVSEESRQKMRDQWADPEWRANTIIARNEGKKRAQAERGGRVHTEEGLESFKEKRKNWSPGLGKKHTPEYNAKIGAANAIALAGRKLPEGATAKGLEVRWSNPEAKKHHAEAMEKYRDPVTGRFLPKEV